MAQVRSDRSSIFRVTGLQASIDTISKHCALYFSYSEELARQHAKQRFQFRLKCEEPELMLGQLLQRTAITYQQHGSFIVLFSEDRTLFRFLVTDQNTLSPIPGTIMSTGNRRLGISNPMGWIQIPIAVLNESDTFMLIAPGYSVRTFSASELKKFRNQSVFLTDISLLPEFEKFATNKLSWKMYQADYFSDVIQGGSNLLSTLGEQDALQSVRMLPGVVGGAEAVPGLAVRGNSPDQNLVLLEDIPLYHAYHLFGFTSALAQPVVAQTQLYKNHAPAKYSGRSGSIIRVQTNSGNLHQHRVHLSTGILNSGLGISGPIVKSKASYSFHLRRSHTDFLILPLLRMTPRAGSVLGNFNYSFYDVYFKTEWKINPNHSLSAHLFRVSDRGSLRNTTEKQEFPTYTEKNRRSFNWGSELVSLKWSHTPNNKKFRAGATAYYSSYNTSYRESDELMREQTDSSRILQFQEQRFGSGIRDIGLRTELDYQINNSFHLLGGYHGILHQYQPALRSIQNSYNNVVLQDTNIGLRASFPIEHHVYSEISWNSVDQRWKASGGVNLLIFSGNGPLRQQLQPRISLGWKADSLWRIYAGYHRSGQFVHWLPGNLNGLPVYQWIPVDENILPLISDQYFAGAEFAKERWLIRTETFIRNSSGSLELMPGSGGYLSEENIEILKNGRARAYGIETMFRAEWDKLSLFGAHTWTRSFRQIKGINNDNWYPFLYDIPHDIKIQSTFKHQKMVFTAMWLYHSGKLLTLPTGRYETEILGQKVLKEDYTKVNNYRLPAYHRLDLNVSLHRKKSKYFEIWRLGVFNSYNHINPILARIETTEQNQLRIQPFGILPILPFIHYEIHF